MEVIAFFPWLRTSQSYEFGEYVLQPKPKGNQAYDLALSQFKVRHYKKDKPLVPVIYSTVLTKKSGILSDGDIEEIFEISRMIAFSAMAKREFFSHSNYFNALSRVMSYTRLNFLRTLLVSP
jgi:hypothetical protein